MGYEDRLIKNIDSKRASERLDRRASHMDDALSRARTLFSMPEYAIQVTDFADLYHGGIAQDMRRVKEKQDRIRANDTPEAAENAKIAEVFEAITLEHAELSNWLGQEVSVLKAAQYDDYFNGVDLIAEWQQEDREPYILSLAVDVTFGARAVEEKLTRIKRDIDQGKLGQVKYFKSADGSFRGERNDSARVVVGIEKSVVQELAALWLKNDKKALGAHPIQRCIVDEVCTQLQTMKGYALAREQRVVAASYARALNIMQKVAEEKYSVSPAELEHDRVYREILGKTQSIFK
jgi:hypothetical protein